MKLILVNGQPGAGKTTLAKRLSKETGMPLLCKDDIKEYMFETVGYSDRDWSRKLGVAVSDFQWTIAETMLQAGKSIMLENAFYAGFARKHLDELIQKYHPDILELYCQADPEVRRARFNARLTNGERHPGHHDEPYTLSDKESAKTYRPILGEDTQLVTTTDPQLINYDKLAALIRE